MRGMFSGQGMRILWMGMSYNGWRLYCLQIMNITDLTEGYQEDQQA